MRNWLKPTAGEDRVVDIAVSVPVTQKMLKDLPQGFFRGDPGGIWQPVKLVITDSVRIDDAFFKSRLDGADIEITVQNSGTTAQGVKLAYKIESLPDANVLCQGVLPEEPLAAGGSQTFKCSTESVKPILWYPHAPKLYRLIIEARINGLISDQYVDTVGFRTFQARDGRLYLNGQPYWLRGGNHFPAYIRPNDEKLAEKFMKLALAGNVNSTRTHCSPFTEVWLDAADRNGILVSCEGTWPWLMLRGDPPSEELINLWKKEWLAIVKKYRNHPSLVMWTMNNEMKFYFSDTQESIKRKFAIVSDAIGTVRQTDPTRPVVADSAYVRKAIEKTYNDTIKANNFDDGDIDDLHGYINWYSSDFFNYFKGEFGDKFSTPGRPLIAQELSTGYPRSDDGHPTRSYLFEHQTPQALVGDWAYEHTNPEIFLKRHSMMTKELAEVLRRVEHERMSGVMLFAYSTWFYNAFDSERIMPMLTARELVFAYQPVLVSAELYGRHYYAGKTIPTKVTVVNDRTDFNTLPESQLNWSIEYKGQTLTQNTCEVMPVSYYGVRTVNIDIHLPGKLPQPRINAKLHLKLRSKIGVESENFYDLVIAEPNWAVSGKIKMQAAKWITYDPDKKVSALINALGIKAFEITELAQLKICDAGVLIVGSVDKIPADYAQLREFANRGGRVVLLQNGQAVKVLLPEVVSMYKQVNAEIISAKVPEHRIFEDIEPLDLAWFDDGKNVPYVATGRFVIDRMNPDIATLAENIEIHGYLKTRNDFSEHAGVVIFKLKCGKGSIWVSEVRTDALASDPIAGRLYSNLLIAVVMEDVPAGDNAKNTASSESKIKPTSLVAPRQTVANNVTKKKITDGLEIKHDIKIGEVNGIPILLETAVKKDAATGSPLPAILMIHGGGWKNGTARGSMGADLPNPGIYYAQNGYFVASVGYRLSGQAKWPAQIQDCKLAIRYLRANARELNIDPNRIGCCGFSAGGHLAGCLGTMQDTPDMEGYGGYANFSSRVQAVVMLSGPVDMTFYFDKRGNGSKAEEYKNELFGEGWKTNPDILKKASSNYYVKPGLPSFWIGTSDKDQAEPVEQADVLADALRKAGVTFEYVLMKNGGHGLGAIKEREAKGIGVPVPTPEEAKEMTLRFFDKYLKINGK
jgi:acetyl esterase/lipase